MFFNIFTNDLKDELWSRLTKYAEDEDFSKGKNNTGEQDQNLKLPRET